MYKKITHTIVEEHFDHPMAKQIKSRVERPQLPTTEVFDPNLFKTNISNSAKSYASNLISLIDSYTGTPANMISEFEKAFSTVDSLGNMTKPFFTSELGEQMNLNFRMMLIYTMLMMQSAKVNQDAGFLANRVSQSANDLINAMGFYNNNWSLGSTETNVGPVLRDIASSIIKKIEAKIAGNNTLNSELSNKLNTDFDTLSNFISTGIMKKFPDRFTPLATAWMGCSPTPSPTPAPTAM